MACDPTTLIAQASCFVCLTGHQLAAISALTLCELSQGEAPVAPTNLDINVTSVTAEPATFFTVLTWQAALAPTEFEVWRQVNAGAYALLATVGGGILTYSDNCQLPFMADLDVFTYKVRAKNGSSFSAFSNEIQSCKGITFQGDGVTLSLSYPLLVLSFGDINIDGNTALLTVSFPVLKRCALEFFITNNQNTTSVTFPAVTAAGFPPVFDEIDVVACDVATLDLSALVNISCTNISGSSNSNLTIVLWNANPFIPDSGNSIAFQSCNLNAATVNRILAIGVANNLTQAFIALDGGTSAAPTGQGIIDKAALITAGCTVFTN